MGDEVDKTSFVGEGEGVKERGGDLVMQGVKWMYAYAYAYSYAYAYDYACSATSNW